MCAHGPPNVSVRETIHFLPGGARVPCPSMDALDEVLPTVAARLPRLRLGVWPTPVEPLAVGGEVFVKREDLSSPLYGGNKVRCLEPVLGDLQARGVRHIWATGAWGSNQALAHAVHGGRMGFECGALLFPQPPSPSAAANLAALASLPVALRLCRSIAGFPLGYLQLRRSGATPIAPGAATPRGALGHLAAGLEVALAIHAGTLPPIRHVVVPVGSTCTTAGLLLGFAVAARLGVGLTEAPHVHAIRVTPWPVTAPFRILGLARRAAALLAALGGPEIAHDALAMRLHVDGRWLGRGYGHATPAGEAARDQFAAVGGPKLDTTYSAKAAAFLLNSDGKLDGPTLFWSTKSRALPPATEAGLARLPARAQRWITRGRCGG